MSIPDDCFIYSAGEVLIDNDLSPCGVTNATNPRVPCCWKGDTCLSDGICIYTHSLDGGSGYTAAGCTDSGFGAGCRSLCTNNAFGDVVYDPVDKAWHCCSYPPGGPLNCTNPSEEQFLAPATNDLLTIQFLPKTGTATYQVASVASTTSATSPNRSPPSASTTTAVTSTSTTPNPTSAPSKNSGLSTGAAAGIGVGAAIGGIVLLGGFIYFAWRRRRNRKDAPYLYPATPQTPSTYINYQQAPATQLHGESKQMAPVEIGTSAK
ncbi:hypothetical protein BDV96DRAFT_594545 [Lophiotrema nucula]|uniref:Mid2 domain-containing protein n=1 Tax=Lophiotrema nucula TaxID=690887 RepID=A0A6A5ZQB5_9PLEO|nr:hypothetical protein BDV96DRAFT_594545 [Lophiotrema nucula]